MEPRRPKQGGKIFLLILGILVGAIASGLFFFFQSKSLTNTNKTIVNNQGLVLSVSSPSDGQVVTDKNVEINGSTGKDSLVAVISASDQAIVKTSGGQFSAKLALDSGENQVLVYAVDSKNGESVQTTLNILYLSSDLASRKILLAADSTTDQQIEDLKQKLSTNSASLQSQNVKFKNSHVTGSIVGLSDNFLSLQTANDSIQNIFTDDLTKYLASGKSTQVLNFTDFKIGDQVSVVGLGKDNSNGYASYVIRLDGASSKVQAVAGTLKDRNDASIFLASLTKSDFDYTVNYTTSTKTKNQNGKDMVLADVKTGDFVLAAGTSEKDGSVTAKLLFVIPKTTKAATSSPTNK